MDEEKWPGTRQEALAANRKYYFTGTQCRNGHIAIRRTENYRCVECSRRLTRNYREKHPGRAKESAKKGAKLRKRLIAEWDKRNADKRRSYSQKYRQKNKEKLKQYRAEYRAKNAALYAHRSMLRKARILKATPIWVDMEQLQKFYEERPDGHHVDHVIPLVHPLVCGLHVAENLQYLPASENMSKQNKWEN